jgi:hypothetical protein
MSFATIRDARFAATAALFVGWAAQSQPVPVTPPTIGSANTATADPSVARPRSTPCRVRLFTDLRFADFSPKSFGYAPPAACPGPWRQVVLEADFSVEAGRQFDRTANLWIGGVNVYFGTTAEPSRTVARAWRVERDLTEYTALLLAPAPGRADLGNLVNTTYTSALWGTAELVFYPVNGPQGEEDAPRTADVLLPLSGGPTGGTVALFDPSAALAASFDRLPTNVERAFLDVVLEHQGANDEFWYACVPDALAAALQSCVGTAFREGEVSLDGQRVGVVPIYPWIFTGGIDPFLWRPIPAVQALNFVPYRIDLTPFAGVLSNGRPHRLAINVFNNSRYFSTTATLLLYLDRGSEQVIGEVTRNTLGAPTPVIDNGLSTEEDGTVSGNLTTAATREFVIEGWVQTSHGKVRTEVNQRIEFTNSQDFVSPLVFPQEFVQNIQQLTEIWSTTKVQAAGRLGETATHLSWPLDLDLSVFFDGRGNFVSQVASVRQAYDRSDTVSREGEVKFHKLVSNSGAWADDFPSGRGQAGSQRYFSADSEGACYSRSIAAEGGVLTSIEDGAQCRQK